jgi:hypothetical protein
MKKTRLAAALIAAALVIAACGNGSESGEESTDRNTAINIQSLQRLLPVGFTPGLGQKAAVVVGGSDTELCTIDHTGSLWCWGRSASALVVNQAPGVSPRPVQIAMPNNQYVTAVASGIGDVTCAIAGGEVFCWGLNTSRQIDGQWGGYFTVPTRIANVGSAVDIAVGFDTACAVIIDGSVRCWGDGRGGAMTAESFVDVNIRGPVTIPFIRNAVRITGGYKSYCVIDVNSLLACWGNNAQGQLGMGAVGPTFSAQFPLGDQQVVDVSMSLAHTCAVLVTGVVKCWGSNSNHQLGADRAVIGLSSQLPRIVDGLRVSAVSVSTANGQSCINDTEGQVWCWGKYPGVNRESWGPERVVGMTNVMAMGSNKRDSNAVCAATWSGDLLCAGFDFDGSLGNGLPVNSHSALAVTLAKFGITLTPTVTTTIPMVATTAAPSVTLPPNVTTTVPATTVPGTVTVPTVAPPVATTSIPGDAAQAQGSSSSTTAPATAGGTAAPGTSGATDSTTASSLGDTPSATLPAASSPGTLRRVLSVKVGKKLNSKTTTLFAGISAPKGSKVKVTVSKAGARFCKTSGTSVQGKKVGVCSVTVGVTPKGQKTRSRTIFVNVIA